MAVCIGINERLLWINATTIPNVYGGDDDEEKQRKRATKASSNKNKITFIRIYVEIFGRRTSQKWQTACVTGAVLSDTIKHSIYVFGSYFSLLLADFVDFCVLLLSSFRFKISFDKKKWCVCGLVFSSVRAHAHFPKTTKQNTYPHNNLRPDHQLKKWFGTQTNDFSKKYIVLNLLFVRFYSIAVFFFIWRLWNGLDFVVCRNRFHKVRKDLDGKCTKNRFI